MYTCKWSFLALSFNLELTVDPTLQDKMGSVLKCTSTSGAWWAPQEAGLEKQGDMAKFFSTALPRTEMWEHATFRFHANIFWAPAMFWACAKWNYLA